MKKRVALLASVLVGVINLVGAAPAQATECTNGKPCPPACRVNPKIYIDDSGNIGWGGSGRPVDCYV